MSRSNDNFPTPDDDDWQRPEPCPMGALLNEIGAILEPIGFEVRMIGERTALFLRPDAFVKVGLGSPESISPDILLDLGDLEESTYTAVGCTLDGHGGSVRGRPRRSEAVMKPNRPGTIPRAETGLCSLTQLGRDMASENRWLAISIAKSFPPEYRLKYDDRVSLGYMGLIHAVAHFNPSLGWKFSTYATKYIRGFICRESMNERLIQAPHYLSLAKYRGHRFRIQAKASLRVMAIHFRDSGLDRILVDPRTEGSPDPDQRDLMKLVRTIIDSMPESQAQVITRCVMGGETLQAVARDLGVSREWIRRIRNESICHIKDQIKIIE